jgi:hypothetical protein
MMVTAALCIYKDDKTMAISNTNTDRQLLVKRHARKAETKSPSKSWCRVTNPM